MLVVLILDFIRSRRETGLSTLLCRIGIWR